MYLGAACGDKKLRLIHAMSSVPTWASVILVNHY